MGTFTFTTELWLHGGMSGHWTFVTLPQEAAEEIRATTERHGFGSVRVHATIGATAWDTSVFPDTERDSFLLPVKAAVRRAERVETGDRVSVTVTTRE